MAEIRKKVFKEHVELSKIFKEHDKDGVGIVNSITFTYILNEYLGIPEDKVQQILKILDPSTKHLVHYMDFVRLVHDQNSLESMPLFKLGEQTRINMLESERKAAAGVRNGAASASAVGQAFAGVAGFRGPVGAGSASGFPTQAPNLPMFGQTQDGMPFQYGQFAGASPIQSNMRPSVEGGMQIPLMGYQSPPQLPFMQGGNMNASYQNPNGVPNLPLMPGQMPLLPPVFGSPEQFPLMPPLGPPTQGSLGRYPPTGDSRVPRPPVAMDPKRDLNNETRSAGVAGF